MKIYCYISTQVNCQRKREIDGRKQDNCCISSSDSLVNMYVWVFITLFWCFLVWYTAFLHVYRDDFWLDKWIGACLCAWLHSTTLLQPQTSSPALCQSSFSQDGSASHPLNLITPHPPCCLMRGLDTAVTIPYWSYPPLPLSLILCLLPPLPPPPCTLLSLLVSVV